MGWSPESAANAYLDTIKLCKLDHEKNHPCFRNTEPQSTEFISALAAGMNAQFIVEVCSSATPSTIALAAAAKQTGGHLVCILPKNIDTLTESMRAMKELGLEDSMEFIIGDAKELLPQYKNIDFSLIDCKTDDYAALFKLLNVNPTRAVVLANNLFDRNATEAYARTFKRKPGAKSITLPIGKGIEVTRIGTQPSETPKDLATADRKFNGCTVPKGNEGRWIVQVDQRTGEEHVFRVSRNRSKASVKPVDRLVDHN
eukprot:Gb_40335 [translate_table: standard]